MISNTTITQYSVHKPSLTINMLQIPQYILENLRCSICEGYLSSKPLMIKCENQQVCGKCYRILPTEEKKKCVRQIGLESLSEICIFPCRYNTEGCTSTFSWCDEKSHEVECPYRTLTNSFDTERSCQKTPTNSYERIVPDLRSNIVCKSEQVEAIFRCEVKESKHFNGMKTLSCKLKIRGNSDKHLVVKNSDNSDIEDVEVNLEGSISIGTKPDIIFMDVEVSPVIRENSYESLGKSSSEGKYCSKCETTTRQTKANYCLFGHNSCTKCKGSLCLKCVQVLEKESKKLCRNFLRGCETPLSQDELLNHQINCKFNDLQCPVKPCNIIDTFPNIKAHLKQHHPHDIFQTNDFTDKFNNKDKTIIVICYAGIFKCVYYYFKTFVEFSVTYLGSCNDSANYFVEITVMSTGNVLTGKSKCCNWNTYMLEKGVIFEKKDILSDSEKKLSFDCRIRILSK